MYRTRLVARHLVAASLAIVSLDALAQSRSVEQIAAEITQSVMTSPLERPLPLSASFLTGEPNRAGYPTPTHQLGAQGWLKRGYHFLPTFMMPAPDPAPGLMPTHLGDEHYAAALDEAKRLNLPLVFYATQWEILLLNQPESVAGDRLWFWRKDTKVMLPGTQREAEWYQVGQRWASSSQMKRLMARYPSPPKVVFISNNEQMKLEWGNQSSDPRVLDRDPACKAKVDATGGNLSENGPGRNCVRIAFQREWKRLYGAMLQGFRDGMRGQAWESKMTLVGYDAFGPLNVGRAHNWMEYSLVTMDEANRGKVSSWGPWTDLWDGGIVSLYTHSWQTFINDYTRASPQAESMNVATQLADVRAKKPNFWFEAGVWDGWSPGKWFFSDKRKQLAMDGQTASPERYAGWVRYVMWMTRAPIVREYRDYNNTIAQTDGHFKAVADATEQVWNDAELAGFWRYGELAANDATPHPYNLWHTVDGDRVQGHRNYFLNTPSHPWKVAHIHPEFDHNYSFMQPVFTMALRRGSDYLVYAHAPTGAQQKVQIELPGAFSITEDVPLAGRFYIVRGGQVVRRIDAQNRAGDLSFTSIRYAEQFLSPGNLAVAWNSKGKVDRLTLTAEYHALDALFPGKPIEIKPLYSNNEGQTNFVIPTIDVPYAMGAWVDAYRGNERVGRGWITLGVGSDALLTTGKGAPAGYALTQRDGQTVWTNLDAGTVRVGTGTPVWLVLYAVGTGRSAWRIDGVTEGDGPKNRVAWKLDYPVRVRIEDGSGNYWVRNADWAGSVGAGYEQINIALTDGDGVPLPSTNWKGERDGSRAPLPRGVNLKVTIEHASSFKDPDDNSANGLHVSNSGVISLSN